MPRSPVLLVHEIRELCVHTQAKPDAALSEAFRVSDLGACMFCLGIGLLEWAGPTESSCVLVKL